MIDTPQDLEKSPADVGIWQALVCLVDRPSEAMRCAAAHPRSWWVPALVVWRPRCSSNVAGFPPFFLRVELWGGFSITLTSWRTTPVSLGELQGLGCAVCWNATFDRQASNLYSTRLRR